MWCAFNGITIIVDWLRLRFMILITDNCESFIIDLIAWKQRNISLLFFFVGFDENGIDYQQFDSWL